MGVLSTIRATLRSVFSPAWPVGNGGWMPLVVHEPYTGAWQHNEAMAFTPETALTNPSVYGCLSRIAGDISKIAPPLLLAQDDEGFWSETTNSAYTPVLRRPNRYQTPQQFVEQWALSRLIYANAYVLKERDDRGVVRALSVLNPARVKVLIAPDGSVYYELQPDDLAGIPAATPPVVVGTKDLIHDRWNCLYHPMVGIPPLYALASALAQAQAIQSSSTTHFTKGGRMGGFLIAPTKIDPLAAERLEAKLAEKAKSGSNIIVADQGMKFEPFAGSAVSSQLIEQLGWIEEKVCEVYGMPISILNSSKQPPYAQGEASQLQYKSQCLELHLTSIATTWGQGLGLPHDLKLEFDDTLLIWMDTNTRVNAAKIAITAGMSPNEVRDTYFGLGPVEGGETPYLQQQNFSLAALAERDAAAPFTQPTPAPTAPPAEPSEEAVAATVGDLAATP